MIWLQLATALFAFACAWLNKWPVRLMRAYWAEGFHKAKERQFHAANAAVKVLWAGGFVAFLWQSWGTSIILFALLLLVQWLVFDPALNWFTEKPLFYLGKTAVLDRIVKNGLVKAAACLALIITLNVLL